MMERQNYEGWIKKWIRRRWLLRSANRTCRATRLWAGLLAKGRYRLGFWRKTGEKIWEFSLFPDFGLFAIFPLEPPTVQSIPTETDRSISRISREILRGWYMGGWKGRIMKAELRNCKRSANGVVKTTQPRVTRLTSQAPSQSVAVSRSDFEEGLENAKCYSYEM